MSVFVRLRGGQMLGAIGHENLVWDGTSPGEELALAHLGFLFRGYRVSCVYM